MNAVRGRVRGGQVEIDSALPEGAEVVVLTVDEEEPFELDDASISELEVRMAEAERGEVEPWTAVLERARAAR